MKAFLLNTLAFMLMTISSCAQNTLKIDKNTDLKKNERELVNHFQKIDILKNVKDMNSFRIIQS